MSHLRSADGNFLKHHELIKQPVRYLCRRMCLSSELDLGGAFGTVLCMVEHGADVGLRSRLSAVTAASCFNSVGEQLDVYVTSGCTIRAGCFNDQVEAVLYSAASDNPCLSAAFADRQQETTSDGGLPCRTLQKASVSCGDRVCLFVTLLTRAQTRHPGSL